MHANQYKEVIRTILASNIQFDGHFEQIINNLSEEKQQKILDWVKNCHLGLVRPEPCKNYPNLITFIYKSNDNKIRGLLTKEKNSYFIEFFLDNHKYYDRKRKYLGL